MATVVLTTVGGALGGPIGAAIGGLAGRAVDGAIFGGRPRQGPRLNELQVQTSSYGTAIPKLFGTIRVAGTVIWATDLRETRTTSGGKGQSTQNYSYSASFAVALSGRPIRAVKRIWAEGKLLRGAAGDWKTRTGFRLYRGDEAQVPDPLIASLEGTGAVPAHRGIAYAVFEDLALADFGNRIPSLTFEVEADGMPVSVGGIVRTLGGDAIGQGDAGIYLLGFAAQGDSIRSAVEGVAMPTGGWFATEQGRPAFRDGAGAATIVVDRGVREAGGAVKASRRRARIDGQGVTIAYHDIARDYQIGVQQTVRGAGEVGGARIELPAVLSATAARSLADAVAARAIVAGEVRTIACDWSAIDLFPGQQVAIDGESGVWRIARWTLEGMVLVLECRRIAGVHRQIADAGITGRPQLAPDVVAGTTRVLLIEMPPDDRLNRTPNVAVFAAGTSPGWRRATLLLGNGGGGWRELGGTPAPAVIGETVGTLPSGPTTIEDRIATVEVALLHDGMTLIDADADQIDRGANAALIGDEAIQFGRAERIGPARWRLSRLWRGRRGSEWAVAAHRAGEPFVLIDPASTRTLVADDTVIGREIAVLATGIADDDEVTATLVPDGRSVVPPSPVHLCTTSEGEGIRLRWTRRSRTGWQWADAVDAALGEEREAYRVTISDGAATQVVDTREAALDIPPADRRRWLEVRQVGTHGLSRPATIMLEPGESG